MGILHVSTSIKGLEALSDYRLKKMAPYIEIDGVPLRTAAQVRRMLKKAQAERMEFLPAKGCANYDERGICKGCAGKERTDEQADNGQSAE